MYDVSQTKHMDAHGGIDGYKLQTYLQSGHVFVCSDAICQLAWSNKSIVICPSSFALLLLNICSTKNEMARQLGHKLPRSICILVGFLTFGL
jgi:hypothetical protein